MSGLKERAMLVKQPVWLKLFQSILQHWMDTKSMMLLCWWSQMRHELCVLSDGIIKCRLTTNRFPSSPQIHSPGLILVITNQRDICI